MKKINFKSLLYNIVMALLIGIVASTTVGANLYAVAGGTFALGFVISFIRPIIAPRWKNGVLMMAVQKEIWQDHIEEEIFKDNGFLKFAKQVSKEHINGRAVHIPQSGGSGNVVKNRNTFPASIRTRTDDDVIYLIDSYSTDPVKIPNVDNYQLSYDKRNSVLGEDRNKLTQSVAEHMLINWITTPAMGSYSVSTIPASRILLTTGDAALATAPDATGNRKKAVLGDLQRMATKFRQENRWFENKMYAMLTPQMIADLFPADSVVTATYMQSVTEEERRAGIIAKVQGWNIMSRSSVYIIDGAGDFKLPGEAGATTDDEASLFWTSEAVEYAMGDMDFFEQLKAPTHYADIFSMEVFTGGRARRNDYLGLGILKQDKSA